MPTHYVVIRYVPSTVRGERVNIGVVAFSDHELKVVLLENWTRVKSFGGNPAALKSVCNRFEGMGVERVRNVIRHWSHSIQMSEPRASLLDVSTLAIEAAKRFLFDRQIIERGYETKADVLSKVKHSLRRAIRKYVNPLAVTYLREDGKNVFFGAKEPHSFDVYAANGQGIMGANAISFEVPGHKFLRRQVDATKWTLDDLMKAKSPGVFAVVASQPNSENLEEYKRSCAIFKEMGADVVGDDDMESWAKKVAGHIGRHMPSHLRPHNWRDEDFEL